MAVEQMTALDNTAFKSQPSLLMADTLGNFLNLGAGIKFGEAFRPSLKGLLWTELEGDVTLLSTKQFLKTSHSDLNN